MSDSQPQPSRLSFLLTAGVTAAVTVAFLATQWHPKIPPASPVVTLSAPQPLNVLPAAPKHSATFDATAQRIVVMPPAAAATTATATPATTPLDAVVTSPSPQAAAAPPAQPAAPIVQAVAAPTQDADRMVPASQVIVQPGQSLWQIAHAHYGSGIDFLAIYRANRGHIARAGVIHAGQTLILPAMSPEPGPSTRVMVRPGQSLWQISQEAYGEGDAWRAIYRSNPIAFPSRVYPGAILTLPPAAEAH
jgi:nucleoid-associated protein YgaU